VLCWAWAEGDPVPEPVTEVFRQKFAEAILEQISFLSFVDGELDMEAIAVSPAGRIVFRRISRPVALPVGRTNAVLRYIADTLSENSAGAAQWLLELAGRPCSRKSAKELLAAMAVVQPQLIRRENRSTAVRAFEGNWRALHSTGPDVPLYLNFLHRNIIAAGGGYELADGAEVLHEAQAAVLGGMMRYSAGEILKPELAKEWTAGLGLVAMEGIRLLGRIAGELRDGTISSRENAPARDPAAAFRARVVAQSVLAALLLTSFLICLRGAATGVLSLLSLASAVGLFWSVWRIG
jgi:hypothetical protein